MVHFKLCARADSACSKETPEEQARPAEATPLVKEKADKVKEPL